MRDHKFPMWWATHATAKPRGFFSRTLMRYQQFQFWNPQDQLATSKVFCMLNFIITLTLLIIMEPPHLAFN